MLEETVGPAPDYEKGVLDWISVAIEEGEAFLKAQDGYDKIDETIRAIMGTRTTSVGKPAPTSNRTGKLGSDLAAMLTDIKPFWEYHTENKRYERIAEITGKLAANWYTERQIDMKVSDALKYTLAAGSGPCHQFWNADIQDCDMIAEDPRDVLPIRPVSNHTYQDAFGIAMRREQTVNYLRARYPEKAQLIVPDRDGSLSTLNLSNTRVGRFLANLASITPFQNRLFGTAPAKTMPRIPTCDVFTVYLADRRKNETKNTVLMGKFDDKGEPETNWSYRVEPGELLYPRKRLIVATRTAILDDGPSPYWHGLFPVTKLTLDPWPWTWLGKAVLWDVLPLQGSLDKILGVIERHMDKLAHPDAVVDKNVTSQHTSKKIDTSRAGGVYRYNAMAGGKPVEIVYPPPLTADVFNHRDWIVNEMDQISGVRDLSQLMRLNQLPGAETMDKLIEAMSPSVRGRSRVIEAFMREFAKIAAYNFAQFYTTKVRLQILGPDGITPEDFDFDPGSFVPAYVHDEDFDYNGAPTFEAITRGPLPRYDRAREFLRQFTYKVAPGSLLASSEIERKLLYLQLARAGIIDIWTLMEVLGIPNVGAPPSGANTITERLQAMQSLNLGMAVNPAGRKASGQTMPRAVVKES